MIKEMIILILIALLCVSSSLLYRCDRDCNIEEPTNLDDFKIQASSIQIDNFVFNINETHLIELVLENLNETKN